ncbi:MAG: zinc dependent phospholipase C family protein [Oscillospiraceae bacterium]
MVIIKKTISILIAVTMLVSSFSIGTYAIENEKLDLSQYTLEEILLMDNNQFSALLNDFERVYDPYHTYGTSMQLTSNSSISDENTITPYWTSGEKDLSTQGSHELITARACGVLMSDKGFWGNTNNGSTIIALSISLASILPDKEWILGPIDLFKGHFYDPDTGKNWVGGTTNTARTNTERFYNEAKGAYNADNMTEDFVEYIGKMLHYIQDASEPHHAANIKANLAKTDSHSKFEEFADENINAYIDQLTGLSSSNYSTTLIKAPGELVYETAKTAKGFSSKVNDVNDQSQWNSVAGATTRNSVRYSAMLLYKISIDLNIILTR